MLDSRASYFDLKKVGALIRGLTVLNREDGLKPLMRRD